MARNTTNFKCFRYTLIQSKEAKMPLEDLFSSIMDAELKDRLRDLPGGKEVRLEDFRKINNLYAFDFIQRRQKGLGRAKENTPSTDIKLNSGELFTDSTVGIYCPKTKQLAIEYNHLGVRTGDVEQYIAEYVAPHHSYELKPWFVNDFERVLKHGADFRRLEFTGHFDELKKLENEDLTISNAIKIAETNGARRVTVSLSAGNAKKSLNFPALKKLLKVFQSNSESLSRLSVKGAYDDLQDFDLNLLDGVIDSEIYIDIPLDSANIPRDRRYKMLSESIKKWLI